MSIIIEDRQQISSSVDMAHPMCWPSRPQFYPMGVNAATSFTQDLSPEQSADILLLGCGDPRSIFYTVSTDVTCPPGGSHVIFASPWLISYDCRSTKARYNMLRP